MPMAQSVMCTPDLELDTEYANQIRHSRVLDFMSMVRTIAGDKLAPEDTKQVATVIVDAIDAGAPLTKNFLINELVKMGRARHRAELIADALLK